MGGWGKKKPAFDYSAYQKAAISRRCAKLDEKEREIQERRDYELAVALSKEQNAPQMQLLTPKNLEAQTAVNARAGQKNNLSAWKYSELRDTINTSTDQDLLQACRQEFQRRLQAYHAWKQAHSTYSSADPPTVFHQQMPSQSHMYAPSAPSLSVLYEGPMAPSAQHRYFRVPFVPAERSAGANTQFSWWAAHFDGQFVVRQMELHPHKAPVLMQAGLDSALICKLTLEETGLTRHPGAEIQGHDFERVWMQYGGAPAYTPKTQ